MTIQDTTLFDAECPLCSNSSEFLCKDKSRAFYRCSGCQLIFADPESHVSALDEKANYDLHNNDPNDPRYRQFLSQLADPMLEQLEPGMNGLDFGCGPGPLLGQMFAEAGHNISYYDPYYQPDQQILEQQYDFVTCTEVVEHFNAPQSSWAQLVSLVKPGGLLGIMTWLVPDPDPEEFRRWGYKGDPTHVSFYQIPTLEWISKHYNLELNILSQRVIIMRKIA